MPPVMIAYRANSVMITPEGAWGKMPSSSRASPDQTKLWMTRVRRPMRFTPSRAITQPTRNMTVISASPMLARPPSS